MNMTLLIDSVDYSALLPRRGYTVGYKKVLGPNNCTTLDGTYHEDVIARKAVVTVNLLPMTTAQLTALLNACDDCVNATFLDTKTNTTVTRAAIATLSSASIALNRSNAVFWNQNGSGITLTIEEK